MFAALYAATPAGAAALVDVARAFSPHLGPQSLSGPWYVMAGDSDRAIMHFEREREVAEQAGHRVAQIRALEQAFAQQRHDVVVRL